MAKSLIRCCAVVTIVFAFTAIALACDFTVRDIGFVKLREPKYSLCVVGPAAMKFEATQIQLLAEWNIGWIDGADAVEILNTATRPQQETLSQEWSIWLLDSQGRKLLLERGTVPTGLPEMEDLIEKHLNTPRMRELADSTLGSFAQIVLFDSPTTSRIEEVSAAAAALRDLEPMLPRPVTLPVNTIVVPPSEREVEHVLLWALGVDGLEVDDAAMAVLYGRGRLAGPTLLNEAIQLRNSIGQLALVGESCECETDRRWLDEREIPFYWTEAESLLAEKSLGFNPGKSVVQAEIERVIARGRRNSRPSQAGDQIERIVSGYLESEIGTGEPALVAIPPGKKHSAVGATVISGAGWDFEPTEAKPPVADPQPITAVEQAATVDQAVANSDPALPAQMTLLPWLLLAAFGLIVAITLWIRFSQQRVAGPNADSSHV